MVKVYFKKLHPEAIVPRRAYGTDAGHDLFILEDTVVQPWSPHKPCTDLRTGIAVHIPAGCYGRLVARSSALRDKKVQVFEGIIDAGFQGELFATVASAVDSPITLLRGLSVCQLIVTALPLVRMVEIDEFLPSERGTNGFGSSGS